MIRNLAHPSLFLMEELMVDHIERVISLGVAFFLANLGRTGGGML